MKTQNTLENKAAFFAQYWGQQVVINSPAFREEMNFLKGKNTIIIENIKSIYNNGVIETESYATNINYCSLFLLPISQISDEDALKLAKFLFVTIWLVDQPEWKILKYIRNTIAKNNFEKTSRIVDFLRSIGCITRWRDLEEDDLIEYGWVKLKTN